MLLGGDGEGGGRFLFSSHGVPSALCSSWLLPALPPPTFGHRHKRRGKTPTPHTQRPPQIPSAIEQRWAR